MTLEAQYMTMLVMSLNGAALGAVYDMYRVVLRHWKFLRWAGPILDFAFWIFSFLLVFWSLMWANKGDLRIYIFVVMAIGLFLYRIFLRKIVVGSTIGIIMGIRYVCIQLYKGFLFAIVRPLKGLFRLLISLLQAADRFLRVLERLILWPFHPLGKLLVWLLEKVMQLMGTALRPFIRLLSPYLGPVVKQLAPKANRLKRFLRQGKGIWLKVTNWLLNRDDDKPKP